MSARKEVVKRLTWLIEGVNEDQAIWGADDDYESGYMSGYRNAMRQALSIIASEFGEES